MTLKIGILSFAHMHAHSYASALNAHPDVQFVGIADPDVARGQSFADQFNTSYYPTSDTLLSESLDGVIVTSENVTHRSLVELAVQYRVKAILCEKPIATTMEDAHAMIAVCKEHNIALATAFPCRYSPSFQRLRAQVQSGAIGDVLAIRGTNHGQMPGDWFVDKALSGGGAVIDHTVHVADLNRWLLGQEVTEVYAEIGNGFYHQQWDDTGFLTLTYSNGVFATLDTSWSRPKNYPTWGDVTLQVVGTGGVIDLDLFSQNITVTSGTNSNIAWSPWGSDIDAGLVSDFLKLCNGQAAPNLAAGYDGMRALEVALAAYRSAELGQPILLSGSQ